MSVLGTPAPAVGPGAPRQRRWLVRIGLSLIALGVLIGAVLTVIGLNPREAPGPEAIRQSIRVTAGQDGESFAIYRLRVGTAESCRVTTATGTAVSITRSPPATVRVEGRSFQRLANFTAPVAGPLTVACPDAPQLFVGRSDGSGRNFFVVVGGLLAGGLLVSAGLVIALIGVVVTPGDRPR